MQGPLSLGLSLWNAALGGGGGVISPDDLPNLAAWYQYGVGITVTGAGVSQWADQSGNARHLVQATDAARPALQGDNSILFDGVDDTLKAVFTLNQPCTIYLLFKQVSWTANEYIFDGNVGDSTILRQRFGGASPELAIYAGSGVGNDANLAVDSYGVAIVIFNGASSFLGINSNAGATLDAGTNNPGGFSLASNTFGQFSNIQVKEGIIYSAAHDAATRAQVVAYLQGFF